MPTLLRLFLADLRMLVRNRQLIFWSFAFPLIFTAIFGLFYGGKTVHLGTVYYVDEAHTPLSRALRDAVSSTHVFAVRDSESASAASSAIRQGKAIGAVIVPAGLDFAGSPHGGRASVTVFYDPSSMTARAAIDGIVRGFDLDASLRAANAPSLFDVSDSAQGAKSSGVHGYFDYVLIGLVGMSLMNSAIPGIAIAMAHYREAQILKRVAITPLPLWQFMTAEVVSRLVLNAVQVIVILGVGTAAFHAHIAASAFLPLLGLAIVGALVFQLIGFTVASLSKSSDAAQGMAQVITIPMMFLGGVFFPIDGLPAWIRPVVQLIPLAPLLRMMRAVAIDSRSPFDPVSGPILIGVWLFVLFAIVLLRFRLSEESEMRQ